MKWEIRKAIFHDGEFKWVTLRHYKSAARAWKWLNTMGHNLGWKFHRDQSLFGGHWVNEFDDCYEVR